LVDVGVAPHFLDTQYRSHPRIAEFSAKCFYGGGLRSGVPGSARQPPGGVPWPNPLVPVAFFEVGEEEVLDGESKANPTEVQRVCDLVFEVIAQGELELAEIGVVTPYMAQVRALRRALRDSFQQDSSMRLMEIASVDAFQGREKELIIFSAVRSNSWGNVGFLADWRRLNVMLTRARRGLVVFGAAKTLRHDPHWQQWLEWCHYHNAIGRAKGPAAPQGWSLPSPAVAAGRTPPSKARPKAKAVKPKLKTTPQAARAPPPWAGWTLPSKTMKGAQTASTAKGLGKAPLKVPPKQKAVPKPKVLVKASQRLAPKAAPKLAPKAAPKPSSVREGSAASSQTAPWHMASTPGGVQRPAPSGRLAGHW